MKKPNEELGDLEYLTPIEGHQLSELGDVTDEPQFNFIGVGNETILEQETPGFNPIVEEFEQEVIASMGNAMDTQVKITASNLEVQPIEPPGNVKMRDVNQLEQSADYLAAYQPPTEKLPSDSNELGATPRSSSALERLRQISGNLKDTKFGYG